MSFEPVKNLNEPKPKPMEGLDDIIQALCKVSATIENIPTSSKRRDLAISILNEYLEEHPEHMSLISALCTYPIQKWAHSARSKLQIDTDSMRMALEEKYRTGEYMGISKTSLLQNHTRNMEDTDKILKLISTLPNKVEKNAPSHSLGKKYRKIIEAIHFSRGEVSYHLVAEHYKDAIALICSSLNEKYAALITSMQDIIEAQGDDTDFKNIYHDTDCLVRLIPEIKRLEGNEKTDFDATAFIKMMNRCMNELKTYPVNGAIFTTVVKEKAKGKSDEVIGNQLKYSRFWVMKRYKEAVTILSYLLWGYSTHEIMCGSVL